MLAGGAAAALERVETFNDPVPTAWKLCVQMRLKDPRISLKDLARALGFASTTVYLWTKNPRFQRYENWVIGQVLDTLHPVERAEREDAAKRISEKFLTHAEEMQDRLLAILDTVDDPKLQASIAEGWLDRAGFVTPRGKQERAFAVVISDEMMQTYMRRAEEAGLMPETIEGEVRSA